MNKRLFYATLTILFITFIIFFVNRPQRNDFKMKSQPYDKTKSFSILTANVGNLDVFDPSCRRVWNKLCDKDVEKRITENIHNLDPDIIVLQEVLAPWQREKITERNKKKVCSEDQAIPQVRRLVGSNYSIICSSRNQFECIAVKIDVGEILGCKLGDLCDTARTAPEIEGCDNGFTISAATVKLKTGLVFDIVNFHPQSTDANCRARMIAIALEGNETTPSLIQEDKVILLGDFNLDPWRDDDESVTKWNEFIELGWNGKNLVYHSGIAEKNPPYYTSFTFYKKRTVDFIVSNFVIGICKTLGESPFTNRLDGGKGTDHRALYGILTFQPKYFKEKNDTR